MELKVLPISEFGVSILSQTLIVMSILSFAFRVTSLFIILFVRDDRVVTSPDAATEDEEDDDQNFMEGYQLDVETFVYNEILLNWPAKILCREECKGVCPVCGQNLNEKECGCDTFVPDPRMAAIKDIFNANKEV